METAIQIFWWIGLVVALGLTLVVLKQVVLLLRTLAAIDRLAEYTREAASGIAVNVDADENLTEVRQPLSRLAEAIRTLSASWSSLDAEIRKST